MTDEYYFEEAKRYCTFATKVIKKNINEQDADKMFNETLEQIGATTWQK